MRVDVEPKRSTHCEGIREGIAVSLEDFQPSLFCEFIGARDPSTCWFAASSCDSKRAVRKSTSTTLVREAASTQRRSL